MVNAYLPKAVLLDRDGVINFDSPDYILKPDQWIPVPGSLQAIARLCSRDIPVAIVSNQSALGRGMIDQTTFDSIHARMEQAIQQAGGRITYTAYCPHAPEEHCVCRKPRPGLVLDALKALNLEGSSASVVFIGDSIRDVRAAVGAHVHAMLVQTGYGNATEIASQALKIDPSIKTYRDLASAADFLLKKTSC